MLVGTSPVSATAVESVATGEPTEESTAQTVKRIGLQPVRNR